MARVGLIDLPAIKLVDSSGRNYTAMRQAEPLVSKQILIPQLQSGGHDVHLFNLKKGNQETDYGTVTWRGKCLTKTMVGGSLDVAAREMDVWGVTVNYRQELDPAHRMIRALAQQGGRVVVGGSDALADPAPYLEAGATLVIQDKSGAANLAALAHVLGQDHADPLSGVMLRSGERLAPRRPPMSPENWPLPSSDTLCRCQGDEYWESPLPDQLLPVSSVMLDIGCDRHCDFCQTPTYQLGYRRMSPETALKWFAKLKAAGARSVICTSDQFLGRVLWPEGRGEVLEIMAGIRALGLSVLWGNGLEMKKATVGRSLPDSDPAPDEELVHAIWGWDGRKGCYQYYLPAERPTSGREFYAILLPWQEHCSLIRAIVRAGVPDITYGVIIGLPDDSEETMRVLEEAIVELRESVKQVNPAVQFRITPFAIRPLPGTPQAERLRSSGLLQFDDPAILGGFWTACANTRFMSYEAVSDWQTRLLALGDIEEKWPGINGILSYEQSPGVDRSRMPAAASQPVAA